MQRFPSPGCRKNGRAAQLPRWPRDLIQNRLAPSECGSLYHAVDGLTIYRTRVWPESDPSRRTLTTAKPVAVAAPAGPESVTNAATNSTPVPEAPSEKPSHEQAASATAR